MSNPTLKEHLIQKINDTNDEAILNGVNRLLELNVQYEKTVQLSESEKLRLSQSKQQIEQGEFIDHDSLQLKIDQWLNG